MLSPFHLLGCLGIKQRHLSPFFFQYAQAKTLSSEKLDMKFLFKTAYCKLDYFLILNSFIPFLKKTF